MRLIRVFQASLLVLPVTALVAAVNLGSGTISTYAGTGTLGYSGDGGAATSAKLNKPNGVDVDASDNLYIAVKDSDVVRKVDAVTGIITTVAGTGTAGYSGDGGAATSAKLDSPEDVAVDSAGNFYIADKKNDVVRKVTAATGVITTFAGTGAAGYTGDGGAATSAKLDDPTRLAIDSNDDVFISCKKHFVVRKVDVSTGIITTFAGTGSAGYTGDGGAATSAKLKEVNGLAFDSSDNLYIADKKSYVIRKVDGATGVITTFAGTGTQSSTGDCGLATSATLNEPRDVAVDAFDRLYIADKKAEVIRRVIISSGIIAPYSGTGTSGYTGDGGPALLATHDDPMGLVVDSAGALYIADQKNHIIRKVDPLTTVTWQEIEPQ